VAGAAIASVLVIAAIALIGGDNSNDQRDEYPFQHSPESGLPGTTVELSGRCTPPEGWRFPGAAFGMDDAEGTKVLDDFVALQDGSWEGQLRIPDGTSAGPYYIWATCYGTPTGAKARNFHDYETTEFSVTNP
jgi:hypothetical protein